MKKTAIIIMIITVISKITGFGRDLLLSYFYGASNVSDAYIISITIPTVIFGFIGVGIASGFIPLYTKIENNSGIYEANKYTNNLINIFFLITSVLVSIVLIFTNRVVEIFASGFDEKTLMLTIQLTKITIFGVYFTGLASIYKSYLQIKGNYVVPALIGIPMNLVLLLAIIISSKSTAYVLAFGVLISGVVQIIILIPYLYKKDYNFKFIIDFSDSHIREMLIITLPLIIGVAVNQVNTVIDRTLASQIASGGVSALNYSTQLNRFVQGIFVVSIATVVFPQISKLAALDDRKSFKKIIIESINSINLLLVPATIGTIIFSEPIVRLLFGRGAFDATAIEMTSYALVFYSVGMIGFGLRDILSRVFFSLQDTKTPMINGIFAMVLNIILNFLLSRIMGIGGLAFATSISAIFGTGLLFVGLRKKIGPFGMKRALLSFAKMVFASLVMGIFSKLIYEYLRLNIFSQNLSLVIAILIGIIIYVILVYLLKIEDINLMIDRLRKK